MVVGKRPVQEVKSVSDDTRHGELRVEDERKLKGPKDKKTA